MTKRTTPLILCLAFAAVLHSDNAAAQSPDLRMKLPCQQNIDNGKILVDGSVLPKNVRFEVEMFEPKQREDMWTFGTCLIRTWTQR